MSKPKSKEYIESSDSDEPKTLKRSNESDSDEDEAPPPPPKAASKKSKGKTNDNVKQTNFFVFITCFVSEQPPAKRSKPNGDAGADDNDDSEVNATIGPNGERLYEVDEFVLFWNDFHLFILSIVIVWKITFRFGQSIQRQTIH